MAPGSLRLKWSRTWEDRERDFKAETLEGEVVGRIYRNLMPGGEGYNWRWSVYGKPKPNILCNQGGYLPTKDEAAAMVEKEWFETLEKVKASNPPASPDPRRE